MPELYYESINPEDYLQLAKSLSTQDDGVAKRTAADRAYYAVFLSGRELLSEKGYLTPLNNERDHEQVVNKLQEAKLLGSYGSQMLRLRLARNQATYNLNKLYRQPSGHSRSLNWMIDAAEKLLERIKALPENYTS